MSHNKPTKLCKSCGQQKLLSAFMQLTNLQGVVYGSICADCRKLQAQAPALPKELEEGNHSATGLKIDAKTKVQGEVAKREFNKQVEEDYFKERNKQSIHSVKKNEKKHEFIQTEKKLRSFLENRTLSQKKTKSNETKPIFGGEEHKAQAGKIDFTAPIDYARTGGEKVKSSVFKTFETWLGKKTILGETAKRANKENSHSENLDVKPLNEYIKKRQ